MTTQNMDILQLRGLEELRGHEEFLDQLQESDCFFVRSGISGIPECAKICARKLVEENNKSFLEPLLCLITKCAVPMKFKTTADDLRHQKALLNTLDAMADLLVIPIPQVQECAAHTMELVVAFIRSKCTDDLYLLHERGAGNPELGTDVFSTEKRCLLHLAVRQSEFVYKLISLLHASQNSDTFDKAVGLAVVRALKQACCFSVCCKEFVNHGGLDRMFRLLEATRWNEDLTFVVVEIIWNVTELNPASRETIGSYHNIAVLKDLVENSVQGYKLKDKEFRNDCIVVTTLLAEETVNQRYFYETEFTKLLFTLACAQELNLGTGWGSYVQTYSQEDFEQKKLVWNILYILSFNEDNAKLLLENGFLSVLTEYINVDCQNPKVLKWPTLQLLELQMQALYLIAQLCLIDARYFDEADGANRLLTFLLSCMETRLRDTTLRVMVHVANSCNRSALAAAGAVPSMLQLIQTDIDFDVKCDCFQIISDLCSGQVQKEEDLYQLRQEFMDVGGIEVLLPYLKMDLTSEKGQHLVYVLVDCVWNCVITHPPSECRFLDLHGVFLLLDVLEKAPAWLQLCVLSCLADFFESNQHAVRQAQRWMSKSTHRQIQKLLVALWIQQSTAIKDPYQIKVEAERLANESPSPTDVPFQPNKKSSDNMVSTKYLDPATTFKSVANNEKARVDPADDPMHLIIKEADLQTKLYCVLKQLGFEPHETLTFNERSTLIEIQSLVDSKNDSMWQYVEDSLKEECIRPVSADQAKLDETRALREHRHQDIHNKQSNVHTDEKQWEAQDEITFYKSLIKKSEDPAVVAKAEPLKSLTITQAKMRKTAMLKASFQSALEQSTKSITATADQRNAVGDTFAEVKAAKAAKNQKRRAPLSAPAGLVVSPTSLLGNNDKRAPSSAFVQPQPPPVDARTAHRRATLSFTVINDDLASGWPREADLATIPPSLPMHVRAFADSQPAGMGNNDTQKFLTKMEFSILQSLNNFRKNPTSILPALEALKHKSIRQAEQSGHLSLVELKEAFADAAAFVRKAVKSNERPKVFKQLPVGMVFACRDHALDIGGKGLLGHLGSDSGTLSTRLQRYGSYDTFRPIYEAIGYGHVEADDVVASMLVDDPEFSPNTVGQREHMLNPEYRYCGIGLNWHKVHQSVVVMVFASSFRDRPRQQQEDAHACFKAMFCEHTK